MSTSIHHWLAAHVASTADWRRTDVSQGSPEWNAPTARRLCVSVSRFTRRPIGSNSSHSPLTPISPGCLQAVMFPNNVWSKSKWHAVSDRRCRGKCRRRRRWPEKPEIIAVRLYFCCVASSLADLSLCAMCVLLRHPCCMAKVSKRCRERQLPSILNSLMHSLGCHPGSPRR